MISRGDADAAVKNDNKARANWELQVSRANAYIPILKQISKDMVEIRERTQALKKRTNSLDTKSERWAGKKWSWIRMQKKQCLLASTTLHRL